MKEVFEKYRNNFHPVIGFKPEKDKLAALDLTADNSDLSSELLSDTSKFTGWVNKRLESSGARFGIGGYAEHRTVYRFMNLFNAAAPGDEPRRLHLGVDIWGKPYTAVMAPLTGIVHSYAFNNNPGDYGATIILSHKIEGVSFHTLYGHLSLNSIKNLHTGQHIEEGEIFAEFGIQSENGQWPPHLHFQVIKDLGNWNGDYPGVCKFSEKEQWLENCPDPDLILQLNQFLL